MEEINKLSTQRRPHLTKEQRLPSYLKEAEKVIRTVKSCQSNFKTVLANSRLRGSVHKKVYNLSFNVLKYYNYIQKIIDKVHLLEKEKFLRREIASILIYEIIFGIKDLPGESKIITTVQAYKNDILNAHQELSSTDNFVVKEINVPRYARIHTLVTTVPYVIKDLENFGFIQITYDPLSEEKYLELVRNLEWGHFLIDFHFKDMLVFACGENLMSLDLYKNGHIFLQDKASYIPVHVLNPEPGCTVLDACAAPGMKTVHIASKMKNKGILIACERDKKRFETLKEMIQYGSVKICKVLCKDFKLLDPSDQAYSDIEYILLDPSCSGSGMVSRMDEVTDTDDSKNKERLMKLAGFQIILLKHALRFPSVKRIVYSTCSIDEEENEYVVHEALNSCYGTFKLVPVMPEWPDRGSENFEFGNLCLRTIPEKHLTNGFFVAMFERVNGSENKKEMHFSKDEINTDNLHEDEMESSFKSLGRKRRIEQANTELEACSMKGSNLHSDVRKMSEIESDRFNVGTKEHFSHEGDEISDNNADVPVHKKKKRKKEQFENGFLENSKNKTQTVQETEKMLYSTKDSKKKKHSNDSGFDPKAFSALMPDGVLLPHNELPVLSETVADSLDNSYKRKKNKKHKLVGASDSDIELLKAVELALGEVINETVPNNEKMRVKSKKHETESTDNFERTDETAPNFPQGMCLSAENDYVKNKKSKKHKNKKHEVEKTDESVFDESQEKCASTTSDSHRNKKSKKHKNKKHDIKEVEEFEKNERDDTISLNPEVISDFTGSDCVTNKKSKKHKTKKHEIEIIQVFEGTSETIPHSTGMCDSIKSGCVINKKSKKHKTPKHDIDDGERIPHNTEEVCDLVKNDSSTSKKHKKHKTKKREIEGFKDFESTGKIIPQNPEEVFLGTSIQKDHIERRKSKKCKSKNHENEKANDFEGADKTDNKCSEETFMQASIQNDYSTHKVKNVKIKNMKLKRLE